MVCDLFNVAVALGFNNLKLNSTAKAFACGTLSCNVEVFAFAVNFVFKRIYCLFRFFYVFSDYFFFK